MALAQLHPPQLKPAGRPSSLDQLTQKGVEEDVASEEPGTSPLSLNLLPKPDDRQLIETLDHLEKQRKLRYSFAEVLHDLRSNFSLNERLEYHFLEAPSQSISKKGCVNSTLSFKLVIITALSQDRPLKGQELLCNNLPLSMIRSRKTIQLYKSSEGLTQLYNLF